MADDAAPDAGPTRPLPPRASRRSGRHVKSVNLALQGGGAHGAFTWGVLDRLFEDDRIWIDALSGTSAGAMNAVVAAQGMYEDGADGARRRLAEFWEAVSRAGRTSPIRRSPVARATGDWSLKTSLSYLFFDAFSRLASPYDVNPFDINPLRDLVGGMVDFDKVRACLDMGVFLGATNVETGRARVFRRDEITLDVVMASACLPTLYHAVEIDGSPYWDGGFMGNPPLYPFFDGSPSNDIVIVQINPVFREGAPRTAQDIQNRMNEITFNSALLHELRAIDFVTRLLEAGKLDPAEYKLMRMHIITSRKRMRRLDASSKLNAEWPFLRHLFDIGRDTASQWLDAHFDDLGERSSVDIRAMFQGAGSASRRPAAATG
ncbi:patatin-like phospholipase family protein [Rubrimonas cliftonensis]|uniref:NTE family protein n=1 Tax=Rubrimonas cliftonensis TaxID=89524 RepID=A0A1H4G0A8_9RHOB|nr:patatin-like phospholipase family protein [Rubrimonas cliftonensis]SEB03029.1 NTE family protein [Rubrimonas cliftonensis]